MDNKNIDTRGKKINKKIINLNISGNTIYRPLKNPWNIQLFPQGVQG